MSCGTVVVQIGRCLKKEIKIQIKNLSISTSTGNLAVNDIKWRTYHPGISQGAFAVTERGGESRGAGFVISGRLSVVGGRINGDSPHTGGISVTVTVVVGAAIP